MSFRPGTSYGIIDSQSVKTEYASEERGIDGGKKVKGRWVVERTFAWLGRFRRLSKDFEILTGTAENRIRIAMLKKTLANCV